MAGDDPSINALQTDSALSISVDGNHNVYTAIWSPDSQVIAVMRGVFKPSLATPGALTIGAKLDVVPLDASPIRSVFTETTATPGEGCPPSWQPLATNSAT